MSEAARGCRHRPDPLTAERVTEYLRPECREDAGGAPGEHTSLLAGGPVLVFDSLDSTNDEVKRRAGGGAGEGLLVIAGEQTAGRGRRGRTWESGRGEGIFMSLLLRPDIRQERAPMLTLVMGMAVRDAVAEICGETDTLIKWPNDIVIDGKKVCGILTEMSVVTDRIDYVVIGVGINVHNAVFPEELARTATSVRLQTGRQICRARIAADCIRRFEGYYEVFLQTGDMSALKDVYNAHLVNRGREVRVLDPDGGYAGTSAGINGRGELLIDTGEEVCAVSSGEVSVRGVYGYT